MDKNKTNNCPPGFYDDHSDEIQQIAENICVAFRSMSVTATQAAEGINKAWGKFGESLENLMDKYMEGNSNG